MLLVKLCRKCKGFTIVQNDNTGKDKTLLKAYESGSMVCSCEN